MKKAVVILLLVTTMSLYSQIPVNWHINFPEDTSTHIYSRGISELHATERAAIIEAQNTAIYLLAQKIFILVDYRFIEIIRRDGSEIFEFALELNNITTRLHLSGLILETVVQREGNLFKAISLAGISHVEADRARVEAENELSAYNVYHFFLNNVPGIRPFNSLETPDYHSWLISNTGIISMIQGDNQSSLNQVETILRVLFPGIITINAPYNRTPAVFIPNPVRLESLTRALRHNDINYRSEYPRLMVYPSTRLNDLTRINPDMVYIIGSEYYLGLDNQASGGQSVFNRELSHRIQTIGKKSVLSMQQAQTVNTGRYLIEYFIETKIEPGMSSPSIPSLLSASYLINIHDLLCGEIIFSESGTNGIPIINEQNAAGSYGLLVQRLLNTSIIEAMANAMGGH